MENLNELAAALAKAQGKIAPAPKDSDNPFFKSRYSSLPAVREAMQAAFAENGLSVVQMPEVINGQVRLRTLLLHASGQTLDCGTLSADVDVSNPQKIASCLTYFRRYALSAVAQVVSDDPDDDGNAASVPSKKPAVKKLSGHDVVALQAAINGCNTTTELSALLKGAAYTALKAHGPGDVYEQTSKLARARHVLLTTGEDPQLLGNDEEPAEEPKPF